MEIKPRKTGNTARGRSKAHTGDPVSRAATGITSKFRAIGNSSLMLTLSFMRAKE